MKHFFLLAFIISSVIANAQSGSISGTLQDGESEGQPLPFASIIIKGSTQGTTSDFDGNYIIENVAPGTYTIEFSFVGYETTEIAGVQVNADSNTPLNTSLKASAAALDEVIITAGGARKNTETALLLDQQKATVIKESIGLSLIHI